MQSWTVWIQIDYIGVINMNNYILEIPDTMGYTIREIQRIMGFPDELENISERILSSDPEIRMLGNKLLETMKDVTK